MTAEREHASAEAETREHKLKLLVELESLASHAANAALIARRLKLSDKSAEPSWYGAYWMVVEIEQIQRILDDLKKGLNDA